jgi:hypothetical protein
LEDLVCLDWMVHQDDKVAMDCLVLKELVSREKLVEMEAMAKRVKREKLVSEEREVTPQDVHHSTFQLNLEETRETEENLVFQVPLV